MSRINCNNCGLVNWADREICLRCKTRLVDQSPAEHDTELSHDSIGESVSTIPAYGPYILGAACVVILLGVFLVFWEIKAEPMFEATAALPTESRPLKLNRRYDSACENSRNAAFWKVSEPNFARIVEEEQKRWVERSGDSYDITPPSKEIKSLGKPYSSLAGSYEIVSKPGTFGACPGRVENAIYLDHMFERVGPMVAMRVAIEGDVYEGNANAEERKCGQQTYKGRLFTEVTYAWDPAAAHWYPRSDFSEALRPEREAKEKAESEKFWKEHRENEEKRERRHRLHREKYRTAMPN